MFFYVKLESGRKVRALLPLNEDLKDSVIYGFLRWGDCMGCLLFERLDKHQMPYIVNMYGGVMCTAVPCEE